MRIGELARRTNVSERSLRYYEAQGLLAADRTPGGHRDYPERAVDRVVLIQELFAAGLHSTKIAQLLPCMRDSDGGPSAVATPGWSPTSPRSATVSTAPSPTWSAPGTPWTR